MVRRAKHPQDDPVDALRGEVIQLGEGLFVAAGRERHQLCEMRCLVLAATGGLGMRRRSGGFPLRSRWHRRDVHEIDAFTIGGACSGVGGNTLVMAEIVVMGASLSSRLRRQSLCLSGWIRRRQHAGLVTREVCALNTLVSSPGSSP